jgi:hypothetical protein
MWHIIIDLMLKRYFFRILIISIIIPAYPVFGQGLDLYVSTDGNDAWEGTSDKPLKSLIGARNKIRELKATNIYTDTIRVNITPGLYHMQAVFELQPADGGSPEAPVVYEGIEAVKTIFSGGIKLDGFTETESGIWSAYVPEVTYWNWTFDQLYVNGNRAVRARSPNTGYYYMEDVKEEVWVKGNGRAPERARQIITADAESALVLNELDEKALSTLILTAYHNWDITKRYIDSFDPENNYIFTSGQGMKPWNPWKPGKRFIIENFKSALDQPGEWFLEDNGWLHYFPYADEEIETTEVIAPVLEQLIRIDGDPLSGDFVENLVIRNISFTHSANYLDHTGFEPNQAAIVIPAAMELNGAKHIIFENIELSHLGGYALWMNQGVSYCEVTHSYFEDMGAGGIRVGETEIREEENLLTFSNTIDNNIISSGGHEFPPAVGVWIGQSGHNSITHNDISDFRYTGVSVGWRWGYDYSPAKGNKILYNHIHHIGWGVLSDMSGVYTLGPSEGTEVSNNHVHHIFAYDYGGWGLYTDEGSSHIRMENNLVHHTKTGGFHQHYGKENLISNNIFAFSKMFQLQATRVEDHLSFTFSNNIVVYDEGVLFQGPWVAMNANIDQNIYWNLDRPVGLIGGDLKSWQKNGYDKHSYIIDPGFMDPENGNFEFRNLRQARKIKFNPIDYSTFGVYGNEAWKEKAILPRSKISAFNALFDSK